MLEGLPAATGAYTPLFDPDKFVTGPVFMDGNGRLSRFLFHKVVCGHGLLPNGLVLPVSVAMKRHEERYLQVLQTFSRPARALFLAPMEILPFDASAIWHYGDLRATLERRGEPIGALDTMLVTNNTREFD